VLNPVTHGEVKIFVFGRQVSNTMIILHVFIKQPFIVMLRISNVAFRHNPYLKCVQEIKMIAGLG
jgi:hypothetical protein